MAAQDKVKLAPADFFESVGSKVEKVSATNENRQDGDDDDAAVVEEIESLCMNCHENVPCHSETNPRTQMAPSASQCD